MSACRSCKVQAAKVELLVGGSSGRDAGPLKDGILCMYEANWASQVLTRKASHATSHNKACCQVFQTQRLPGASYVLFVAACMPRNSNLLLSTNSVRVSEDYSLEQVGLDISAPCTHENNSLDVNMAKHVRSSRKVQEDT